MSTYKCTCGSGFSQGLIEVCMSKLSKMFSSSSLSILPLQGIIFHKHRALPTAIPPYQNCCSDAGWRCSPPYVELNQRERLKGTEVWWDVCTCFKVHVRPHVVSSSVFGTFIPLERARIFQCSCNTGRSVLLYVIPSSVHIEIESERCTQFAD